MPEWGNILNLELKKKIAKNLNRIFNDETNGKRFDYYFEPIIKENLSKNEIIIKKDLFRVYPHGKRAFKVSYHPESQDRINIEEDDNLDPITLKNFLHSIDYVKRKHVYYKSDNHPFIDFFEDENQIVILLEIAGMQEDDIELLSSPTEIDIFALGTRNKTHYYRTIQLPSEIDPLRSRAIYNDGILEVLLKKVKRRKKTKIEINK